MAIALHYSTTPSYPTTPSWSITPGQTPVDGNVLIAFCAEQEDDALTSDGSEFTLIGELQAGGISQISVWYRVATASEPSSYSWTCAASRNGAIHLYEFSGVDTTGTIHENWQATSEWATTDDTTSITPSQDNSMIVVVGLCRDDTASTYTFDTGGTLTQTTADTGSLGALGHHSAIGYLLQTTAQATGAYTMTVSPINMLIQGVFNLIPDSGGGSSIPVLMNHYSQMRK